MLTTRGSVIQATKTMRTKVAILGGGLAGLHAARLLHSAGVDFQLLEARERLGGRILTSDETGSVADGGLDLGPSWFWPEMQPSIGALVDELGLAGFAQNSEGDVIFERTDRETPQRYPGMRQVPESMRLTGGTGSLVTAIAKGIPGDSLQLGARVTHMALGDGEVTVTISRADGSNHSLAAEQAIAAIPPRLLEATVSFTPAMESAVARRWRETATWMAPHAKFFALYDRPFWREVGLSGTAQSMVGPLVEIHDATTASGTAALFGFLGVDANQRASVGEERLVQGCVEQLGRLFGPQALHPRATLFKDWAADALTATPDDKDAGMHPVPQSGTWVTGPWRHRLSLAGSETSMTDPGYLAGAVDAGRRAVAETLGRLGRAAEDG